MNYHENYAKRNKEMMLLYAAGYTFDNVALAYDVGRERVRQLWHREMRLHTLREDYRQRTSTPEEVYWETELFRNRKLRYGWPAHRKTPKPYVPPPQPPPQPSKPVWVLKLVTYPEGQFLGVAALRGDNVAEVVIEAQKLNICPDGWVGEVTRDEGDTVPGDLIGRFTSKEELITRNLVKEE